jgi:LAO/AO transport system kinase
MPEPVDVDAYVDGVLAGARGQIARAITLVESHRPDHMQAAQEMLVRLLPHSGQARRIGISGVPGVGKSTFIDAFGSMLTGDGLKVAVLAIDPSSSRVGGSILGDKTRMTRLGVDKNAFVRPSPTSGHLGGVARATRESIIVVEAAGYDVVLVETVGVGQSETAVADMVDTFLLLALARTGDQLQGIKKGILELADIIAVNKADGPHIREAKIAARDLQGAMRMMEPRTAGWQVPVLTCSGAEGLGLAEVWQSILDHHDFLLDHDLFDEQRREQQVDWTWAMVRDQLLGRLRQDPAVAALTPALEADVRAGRITATLAAQRLVATVFGAR